MRRHLLGFTVTTALLLAAPLAAQGPTPLAAGAIAPEFVLDGGTMDGPLGKPFRLSDYRDQTVVIAFFYKARTGG